MRAIACSISGRNLRRMSDLNPASDVSGPGRDFAVGPDADIAKWLLLRFEAKYLEFRKPG